ncbi:MAG: type II secretion system minor pseudopilin GspK [Pseudomonadota bacterium]
MGHAFNHTRERGSALLSVLLILGVVSAVMVALLGRINTAVRITQNAQDTLSARYQANSAEALARLELANLLERNSGAMPNVGGWNGRATPVPLDDGLMTLTISDHTDCFNLNSLVTPSAALSVRPAASRVTSIWPDAQQTYRVSLRMQSQFVSLLEALDFSRGEAQRLAAGIVDWIDSDAIPGRLGVEDGYYTGQKTRYRTANQLLRSVSEILDVRGVTKDVFERLKPWLCAHPSTSPSPMNVNLLTPDQAPLLMMLAPQSITSDAAMRILANVPVTGWQSPAEFWSHPSLLAINPDSIILDQTDITSRYFILTVDVATATGDIQQTALFEAAIAGPRLSARTWQGQL